MKKLFNITLNILGEKITKKLLKFTIYTLMSVGLQQIIVAMEGEQSHEPAITAVHEAPVGELAGKPVGEIATANAAVKTKVALDNVNTALAKQAPKVQPTAQGFDLGSTNIQTTPVVHEAPVTSTELTLFESPTHTNEVVNEPITSNELVAKDTNNVNEKSNNEKEISTIDTTTELTSQELTTLQDSAEKQFESGDRKSAAENTLATVDPNNTIPKDVQENLKAEFEKGPKNGQSWSDFFKSMYEKIVQAMSDAMASAKSAITGNRVTTVIDPKTKEQTTTEINKGIKTKSTTIDATGKVLSVDVYDPTGKNVIKSTANEYDASGKTVRTDTNQYDATGKTVLAKHTVELDPVTGRQLKSEDLNYDPTGKIVIRSEDTFLNKDGQQQTVATLYDSTGKVPTSTIEYDQNDNITKVIKIKATPDTIRAYDTKAKLDADPTHNNDAKANRNQSINNPIDTRTPFTTLGIPENATEAEIKSAYKKLTLVHHPDKNPDYKNTTLPEENVKLLSNARDILMKKFEAA